MRKDDQSRYIQTTGCERIEAIKVSHIFKPLAEKKDKDHSILWSISPLKQHVCVRYCLYFSIFVVLIKEEKPKKESLDEELDEVQSALELEIGYPQDLEEDIEYADKFRRQVRVLRIQAAQRLLSLEKLEKPPSESGSSGALAQCNVRLPELELPKFSGVLIERQSFWDRFVAVGDSDIPIISKSCYLQSLLEGQAKSVIQGLSQTSANYPIACKMSKERFGRPERIIFAHIQALLGITMPAKNPSSRNVSSLWKLQDELLTLRSLEALGVDGNQYGVFMTPVILSRLPPDIRLEWSREGSGHERDLDWLLNFLQREIESRERSDTFKDINAVKTDNHSVESEKRSKFQGSTSALQTSGGVLL
ncbi:uncharacterized protein [Macrobrachium rosenbergii]|uniref:uncharacterized protein n=1 Tax=Macrobrachium rosenbergii TaxID=79674 RepID=UPI0034D77919